MTSCFQWQNSRVFVHAMNHHMSPATDLTTILRHSDESPDARSRLWQAAYQSLRDIARGRLGAMRQLDAMDTGTLINESYLRMSQIDALHFQDRKHFFAYASQVMRSVIVDRLREKQAGRRGGAEVQHVTLDTDLADNLEDARTGLEVHAALEVLARTEPRLAKVVEMRYFAGMTDAEIGEALDMTERTVRRDWTKARLLLHALLAE